MKEMKKLLRRKSAGKVCPEGVDVDEINSEAEPGAKGNAETPVIPIYKDLFGATRVAVPLTEAELHDSADGFISVTQLYNCMNDGQLSPLLYDPTFLLLVDCRSTEQYKERHILTAQPVANLQNPILLHPLSEYTLIVLYDQDDNDLTCETSDISKTAEILRGEKLDFFILTGGFQMFHKEHPYLCINMMGNSNAKDLERKTWRDSKVTYPSIILKEQLYHGKGNQATCKRVVTDLHISHVINITKEHQNAFPDMITYYQISLDDENTTNLMAEFSNTNRFIDEALKEGGRVLIHCNLGVSRSSTIVLAYLMYKFCWVLGDAFRYLQERRPAVLPNRGFFNQLSKYEEMLFGRKVTQVDKLWA